MRDCSENTAVILRPAILLDDRSLFYVIFVLEIAALLVGIIMRNQVVSFLAIVVMGVLPGMPIFFHTVFHFSVEVRIFNDRLLITSYAGDNVIRAGTHQEIFFGEIAFVYCLEREIDFIIKFLRHLQPFKIPRSEHDLTEHNLTKKYGISREESLDAFLTAQGAVSGNGRVLSQGDPGGAGDLFTAYLITSVDIAKYLRTEGRAGGFGANARARACLVLSNKEGSKKVYFANFYDLSGDDSRKLLEMLREKNPKVRFQMDTRKVRRLFGQI